MDTLGSLCDKLIVVKLKERHTLDTEHRDALIMQAEDLKDEIDFFVRDALEGRIPFHRLTSNAYKVHSRPVFTSYASSIGEAIDKLAWTNCDLWHEVDKSYHVDDLSDQEKSLLVKRLADLNIERNAHKEAIDDLFSALCK